MIGWLILYRMSLFVAITTLLVTLDKRKNKLYDNMGLWVFFFFISSILAIIL
jgi:hypothetical protein